MNSPDEILELEDAWRMCRRRIDALLADPDFSNGTVLTGFKIAYSHAKPRDPASFHAIYQDAMLEMAQRYQEIQARGQALSQLHLLRDHSDPVTSAAYPQDVVPFAAELRDLLADLETHAARLRPDVPKRHQAEMDDPFRRFSSVALALITALDESSASAKRLHHAQSGTKSHGIKPGYKQTEVGVIPKEWEVKEIDSICTTITTGKLDANAMRPDGAYRFYTCAKDFYQIDKYAFDCEALLISGNGAHVGYIHYYYGKFNAYQRTYVLCGFKQDIQYVYHYLAENFQRRIEVEVKAGGTPYITRPTIAETKISFPPLPEQRAIAAALSEVDALLAALDRLIAKKRDLKQAAMQQLLTGQTRLPGFEGEWVVRRLGELGEVTGAGVDKKVRAGEQTVRLVNYMDVYKRDFIASSDLWHEVSARPDQARRCAVEIGDVFFTPTSEVRDDIGHSAVAVEDVPDAAYSYHVVRLRIRDSWDVRFRAYAFKTKHFTDQASMLCEGSGTRYVITLPKFRSMTVRVPSEPAEQTAIASVLSDMDAELAALEQRREKTRALKQGMMQELLTGRTRLV